MLGSGIGSSVFMKPRTEPIDLGFHRFGSGSTRSRKKKTEPTYSIWPDSSGRFGPIYTPSRKQIHKTSIVICFILVHNKYTISNIIYTKYFPTISQKIWLSYSIWSLSSPLSSSSLSLLRLDDQDGKEYEPTNLKCCIKATLFYIRKKLLPIF